MRSVFLILVALVFLPLPAYSGFVANRNEWLSLTPGEKTGFAMGAVDAMYYLVFEDRHSPASHPDSARIRECLSSIKFNTNNGPELITFEYQSTENWGLPALAMLDMGVRKMCRSFLER